MTSSKTRSAAVALLLVLLSVAFAPAARAGTTISLRGGPSDGVWGTTFTFEVSTSPNIDVIVQRKYVGSSSWVNVANARTTDSDGKAVYVDKPVAHADYRSYVVSDRSTSNWVHVLVRPGVVIQVGRSGSNAVFSGRVLPGHAGTRVILQMFDGNDKRWITVRSARLSSSSSYRIAYQATDNGRRLFRVAWPTQDENHLWNLSAWVWVTWTRS